MTENSSTQEVISRDLFVTNPELGIAESEKLIAIAGNFPSYNDFVNYYKEHSHRSMCQTEWSTPHMSIHCFECGEEQSCICLNCFLNSNHEGHHYIISPSTTGNCDCGDPVFFKEQGFCTNHKQNHEQIQLEPKLKKVLTDVFAAACSSFTILRYDDSNKVQTITNFLSSFFEFGDAFRHLIVDALTTAFDFVDFFVNLPQYPSSVNAAIRNLCGPLINNPTFREIFSKSVFKFTEAQIIPNLKDYLTQKLSINSFKSWFSVLFHAFSKDIVQKIVQQNWNWVDFAISFMKAEKCRYDLIGSDDYGGIPSNHSFEGQIMNSFAYMTNIQPNEQTQLFFDRFVTEILATPTEAQMKLDKTVNNTIITLSFKQDTESRFFNSYFIFFFDWHYYVDPFQAKPNLNISKLFEVLDSSLDLSPIYAINWNSIGDLDGKLNENDKLAKKYLGIIEQNPNSPTNYKSFHNGGSFFFSHPLSQTFISLFHLDDLNRERICENLLKDGYRPLRTKLTIVVLKYLLSMLAKHESVTPGNNHGLSLIYDNIEELTRIQLYIPMLIPVLQLLLGLKTKESPNTQDSFCLKEFFIFEFARELGFFDNFSGKDYEDENIEERQKTYTFTILYYALMLVLERILFTFDHKTVAREQIIFALANGNKTIKALMESFGAFLFLHGTDKFVINEILTDVAIQRINERSSGVENEEDSSNDQCIYALKEGIEWKTITGVNSLNAQKTLLNNKLTKNPNDLLSIPEFEPEDSTYFKADEPSAAKYAIYLKDLLFTPTVLSIAYHTLASSSTGETANADLNDQLAMNILILAAQLAKEINSPSSIEIDQNSTISYITQYELINKMKSTVFKLHEDESGNATIENTIANEKSFASLLNMKITYYDPMNKEYTRSFIDLLNQKGKAGKEAIQQISSYLNINFNGTDDDAAQKQQQEEKRRKQKERAALLKREIMNQYKDNINNYRLKRHSSSQNISLTNASTSSDLINSEKEVCSVCSTSYPNEVLSYPLYIYRTKMPFIFDKPPIYTGEQKKEFSINDDHFDQELFDVDPSTFEEDQNEIDMNSGSLFEIFGALQQMVGESSEEDIQMHLRLIALLSQTLSSQKRALEYKKIVRAQKQEQNQYLQELGSKPADPNQIRRLSPGWNYVLQFSICQHLLHPACIDSENYECPIDRSTKNAFLPDLADVPPEAIYKADDPTVLSEEVQKAINIFLKNYMQYFFQHNTDEAFDLATEIERTDLFVELIKSISGLIVTYEVRLRSFPGCLDAKKNMILTRNLFLTAWYAYRMYGKPKLTNLPWSDSENNEAEVEMKMTTFQKFIKELLENDDVIDLTKSSNALNQIAQVFIHSDEFKPDSTSENDVKKNDKKLCLFLRRVCLSDYFLLENEMDASLSSAFIEWDQILSPQSLAEIFKVKFPTLGADEEFDFKPFRFTALPKEFLKLYLKPYEFPIDETLQVSLFNLLDYNQLIESYNDFDEFDQQQVKSESSFEKRLIILPNDDDEVMKRKEIEFNVACKFGRCHYPTVLLFVGAEASRVLVIDQNRGVYLNPFYLDQFGSPDIGYDRGQPLLLKETKYDQLVEEILSGDFTSYLKSFIDF